MALEVSVIWQVSAAMVAMDLGVILEEALVEVLEDLEEATISLDDMASFEYFSTFYRLFLLPHSIRC